MTENEEFYKLTFSQRERKIASQVPEPMRLEFKRCFSRKFQKFGLACWDKAKIAT